MSLFWQHRPYFQYSGLLQDMAQALTAQNSELRGMLIKATETRSYNPDSSVEQAQREDVVSFSLASFILLLYELVKKT